MYQRSDCGCDITKLYPLQQFFREAKESLDYLKGLQDAIQRKYGCDRTSNLHRLEDLIQESMVRACHFISQVYFT